MAEVPSVVFNLELRGARHRRHLDRLERSHPARARRRPRLRAARRAVRRADPRSSILARADPARARSSAARLDLRSGPVVHPEYAEHLVRADRRDLGERRRGRPRAPLIAARRAARRARERPPPELSTRSPTHPRSQHVCPTNRRSPRRDQRLRQDRPRCISCRPESASSAIEHGGDQRRRGPGELVQHLLKYDSVYGRFPGIVEAVAGGIVIDGKAITTLDGADPRTCRGRSSASMS